MAAFFFFPFLRPGCRGVGRAERSEVLARCRGRTAIDSAAGMSDADRGKQALGTWGEEHSAASLSSCRDEDASTPKQKLLEECSG